MLLYLPRGIDFRVLRKYSGLLIISKIGYVYNTKAKHLLSNYHKKFTVNNLQELDLLLMNDAKYWAEIGASVGAVKRVQTFRRAKELNIRITNQNQLKFKN